MNKIKEVLSDEKQDWEHRVTAVSDFLPFPAVVDKIKVKLRMIRLKLLVPKAPEFEYCSASLVD